MQAAIVCGIKQLGVLQGGAAAMGGCGAPAALLKAGKLQVGG